MQREFSAGVVPYFVREGLREYLLLRYESGHFDFPKGHLEGDETSEDAALRELKEETGLSAKLDDQFKKEVTYYFKDSRSKGLIFKTVYFFVGQTHGRKVTLSHEHVGFEWLPYDKALQRVTFNNAKEVLRDAEAFLREKYQEQ